MQKLTFYVLIFSVLFVNAQHTFSVTGTVTDNQDESVEIGDILLFQAVNDTLVKYTSLVDGTFSIKDIPEGAYRLRISCSGFKVEERILELNKPLSLKIQLQQKTTDLDEVEVVAAKPILTNENGNLKIDVSNPVFASIPDPMDLLSSLPNVQISPDRESITVLGKGNPLIYIGNQRITIQEFNALSVDDISTIEIIRNPSAKYEADGRALLLVTRKRNASEGYKLNLSETASMKRNFNNYTSLNGSFHNGKLTIKGNLAYNNLLQWESHSFKFAIPEANILSDYTILVDKNDRLELNTGGGLFYQMNDNDYFSADFTTRKQTNSTSIATDTFLSQDGQENRILSKTDNRNTKNFGSGNLNYNKKLNGRTTVFAGIQYSSYVQRLGTEIANNYNATGFEDDQERRQRYGIEVLVYRLDFDTTFAKEWKWAFGANSSNAKANALTDIRFLETGMNVVIDYNYSENNHAAYMTFSGTLGNKVNFDTGIRIENNRVKGEERVETIPLVDRDNTNFFPKANLAIELDSTKNLSFNYAKSIIRPNYSKASSIQIYFNPFLEGEGNVNLLPTLTEELAAVFQFAKNSISFEYYWSENPMYYTIGYTNGADRAVFSLKNLEKESGLNITLSNPMTKGIWTSSNSISLSTNRIEDALATPKSTKPYLYVYTDHQFKMEKDTTISFGGWALTKRSEGIFKRNAMIVLNASITKTFFNSLHCALRFNDITKAMNFKEKYAINGVNADGVYYVDAREIAFSMKYTFGKHKDPDYKNKDVDEHLDRIR